MKTGWGAKSIVAFGVASFLGTGYAVAQDSGGLEVTFSFSSSLETDDNKDLDVTSLGTTTRFDNTLGAQISSETAVSRLTFGLETTARLEDSPAGSNDFDFVNTGVNAAYQLIGPSSELEFGASYTITEVEDLDFVDTDGDLVEDNLVVSSGELESTSYSAGIRTGIDAPLGFGFNLRQRSRDYSGTTDPDLFDTDLINADAEVIFQITPTFAARGFVGWEEYDAEDAESTNRVTNEIGVGADYEVNPALTFSAEVQLNDIETTETVGLVTTVEEVDGISGSVSFVQDLVNGSFGGSYRHDITAESERDTILVQRNIEVPAGQFNFSLGVSDSDTGPLRPVGSVTYVREMPAAQLRVDARQTARSTDDAEDILTTQIDIGYFQEISPVSGIDVTLGVGRSEDIGGGTTDEATRTQLQVAYRRELTDEWDLRLGYRGRTLKEEGLSTATSNALFATISRSLTIRP